MLLTQKIAIAVSQFNSSITDKLLQGTYDQLRSNNINENNITVVHVPGAMELPLTAKILAKTKDYDAIICLGAVIRGETDHYDYVCQQVSSGCMQVMLELEIPIIFGVLTTENELQAQERVGGKEGHKGKDSADAALKMISVVYSLKSSSLRCTLGNGYNP